MTRPIISVVIAIGVSLACAGSADAVFRAGTSAVMVDVSVKTRSGRVVTGLTATDFVIQDNGVRQDVSAVSYGKVPIDVTVGLDVSTSVTGPLLDRSGAR